MDKSLKFLDGLIFGVDLDENDLKDFESSAKELKWREHPRGIFVSKDLVRVDTESVGRVYIYSYDMEACSSKMGLIVVRGHETLSMFNPLTGEFSSEYTR